MCALFIFCLFVYLFLYILFVNFELIWYTLFIFTDIVVKYLQYVPRLGMFLFRYQILIHVICTIYFDNWVNHLPYVQRVDLFLFPVESPTH